MKITKLKRMIALFHKPELATSEETGHVYHVYSDGEISYQKAGSLYNCRTEHAERYGRETYRVAPELFPLRRGEYGFIICDGADAETVSNLIQETKDKYIAMREFWAGEPARQEKAVRADLAKYSANMTADAVNAYHYMLSKWNPVGYAECMINGQDWRPRDYDSTVTYPTVCEHYGAKATERKAEKRAAKAA